MTSEKLLRFLLWSTSSLAAVSAALLIYIYACGSTSATNKFQAWACLGICLSSAINSRAQLHRKQKK